MDSFEFNKIVGALLGTILFVLGLGILSGIAYAPRKPLVPGYNLPVPEEAAAHGAGAPAAAEPLPVLLARADPSRGEKAVAKCKSCHVFDKGGANKIGPALYGVLGAGMAAHDGFAYSAALKGKGGKWGFEEVNAFLANPKQFAQGTLMNFAGVPKAEERADIIAYLRSLSDNPVPLPEK